MLEVQGMCSQFGGWHSFQMIFSGEYFWTHCPVFLCSFAYSLQHNFQMKNFELFLVWAQRSVFCWLNNTGSKRHRGITLFLVLSFVAPEIGLATELGHLHSSVLGISSLMDRAIRLELEWVRSAVDTSHSIDISQISNSTKTCYLWHQRLSNKNMMKTFNRIHASMQNVENICDYGWRKEIFLWRTQLKDDSHSGGGKCSVI